MANSYAHRYSPEYEQPLIRGDEDDRPWNILELIRQHVQTHHSLLDVGCGTPFKTICFAHDVAVVTGLDINPAMLEKAAENIKTAGVSNFELVQGDSQQLPFPENSFDIVACIMAPQNPSEIWRVLKPEGWTVVEQAGDRDKWNFKQRFPRSRRYLGKFKPGQRTEELEQKFKALFAKVEVRTGFWPTYYTEEQLLLLFQQTPIVTNFDPEKDQKRIAKIVKKYTTERGIRTTQSKILIIAKK